MGKDRRSRSKYRRDASSSSSSSSSSDCSSSSTKRSSRSISRYTPPISKRHDEREHRKRPRSPSPSVSKYIDRKRSISRSSRRARSSDRVSHDRSETPRPSTSRIRSPVRANEPEFSHSMPAQTSQDYEARIEKLESVISKFTKQNAQLENRRMAIKSDCIPEFDPENEHLPAEKWLDKIEQLKVINDWDDVTTIYHMQSRLSGMAKSWYHNLTSYKHTWEEWKTLIGKTFPVHTDYAVMIKKMIKRTKLPTETMTTYYFQKMELLRTCQITGKNAVSCLIDGISNATIQNSARASRYESPEILYEEYLSTIRDEKPVDDTLSSSVRKVTTEKSRARVDLREPLNLKRKLSDGRSAFSNVRCFNCKQRGHVHSKCPQPRMECKRCHMLGHEASTCPRNVSNMNSKPEGKTFLCITKNRNTNACYFIDCVINGEPLRGYVDSGCNAVTIRESDAVRLNLERTLTNVRLRGFGGGSVQVTSSVSIELEVDLATAKVKALVVPDNVQQVSVIVGQPFINNENVVVVVRGDQVRLFNNHNTSLENVDKLPRKINLCAVDTTVIPPNHIGHISVFSDESVDDVLIDLQYRTWPDNFHVIPRCVTNLKHGGFVPIMNTSDHPVRYKKGRVVARGYSCLEEPDVPTAECLNVRTETMERLTLNDIRDQVNPTLSKIQRRDLLNLLNTYRDCFATNLAEVGKTDVTKMTITLSDDKPITYRPYRMAYPEREKVRAIVEDLVSNGIVQESQSPYASPILLVKKKNGEERLCVDYRALNRITIKDKYPLPRIDDLLDGLKGRKFYTSLDLASGYHQIPVDKDSISKTAFVTPDGHYEYTRMPFGLVNAPAVFQRSMNKILGALRFSTALAYLDDVLIPSGTIEEGMKQLETVLRLFKDAKMTLRLDKCFFLQTKINYLGHEISDEGIKPGQDKIKAVAAFPRPTNVHEIRRFLGLASYFRKFIKDFATIAKPLSSLTRKDVEFCWKSNQELAFETLKSKLVERPVLAVYNRELPIEVHCDASKLGLGGILLQKQSESTLKPVFYFSRSTTADEQKYHSYELETLAVVETLKKFRIYLVGNNFKVVTDCNSLRFTLTKRDLIPRIARWWLAIQEFDFSIEYRPGTKMNHVDALSRGPLPVEETCETLDVSIVDVDEGDWVLSAQLQDGRCKTLIDVLSHSPTNTEEDEIHKEYCLKEGRLFKVTPKGRRWVTPRTARRRLLMFYHDEAGHFAVDKTLESLSKRYWFPSMRNYVRNYIRSCLGCLYNKRPSGKRPGRLNPIDKEYVPMDTLHIDHLGPFTMSPKKNSYLLVIIDAFTKFTFMKAVPNTKTNPVIHYLNEIIDTFGVPRRIICDRGSAFTSKMFSEFCSGLGIKRVLCATATPRANGQVERMNRTILAAIMSSTDEETRWDEAVHRVKWGINNSVSSATNTTPYETFFGYRPRGVNDAFLTSEVCDDEGVDVHKLRKDVSQTIVNKQRAQKQLYDAKRSNPKPYDVGQHVLIQRPKISNAGMSRKLEPRYKGPFIVTKVLDHDRYVVKDMPGAKRSRTAYVGICPSDKMKPFSTKVSSDEISAGDSSN